MFMLSGRALARPLRPVALAAMAAFHGAALCAAEVTDLVALELEEAVMLAVADQPLLRRLDEQLSSARERVVAAQQLPDPQLSAGVSGLPVNTADAYSFTRDADTQLQIALQQEFPRAAKRRARGEIEAGEAQRLQSERLQAERAVRRDAGLAWLELWRYDQALSLTRARQREAQVQTEAVAIALKAGTATQADLLGARVEAARLLDAVAGAEQSVAHAQNNLSRWIGAAAYRPVCPDLPDVPAMPSMEEMLARVQSHPQLVGLRSAVAAARAGTQLAHSAYRPDWRAQLGYAHRAEYSDLVSLQVGIDLPVFTHQRQDRELAAARATESAAQHAVEDALRQLQAEARLNLHDWVRLETRLRDYQDSLLLQAGARIEAALAGWRSGRAMLRDVLEARRAELELRMAQLDLQYDAARHLLQLRYLGAFDAPDQVALNRELP